MLLAEYLSPDRPTERLGNGVVKLDPADYQLLTFQDGLFLLYLNAFKFAYVVREGDTLLYTMNDYGAPKSASVFATIEPLKN